MTELTHEILKITSARAIAGTESVQTLWSGYGEIKRYFLTEGKYSSIIVKYIQLPESENHPRGWNTEISHQRKLKSYQVETNWYQNFAHQTDENCRVPKVLKVLGEESEILIFMEDLDADGFDIRLHPGSVTLADAKNCLTWLAHFHAKFMAVKAEGLWPIGTYWHLDTRPDEFEQMGNQRLKQAAHSIDQTLNQAKFQTLVHGDAKLANFCFSPTYKVAVVDFQYVGKGCGMKDVAYFISSCFDDRQSERHEAELLDHYFSVLEMNIDNNIDFQVVKTEWSALYKYAWADFYRFLDGWSPGHWKMHSYSERLTKQVINELKKA
jgi:hypothetical protein